MAKRTLKGDLKRIKNSPAARDLRAAKTKISDAVVNRGKKRDIGSNQRGPGTTAGGSRIAHFGTDCATCVSKSFKEYPSIDGLNL
jgi:hypothetical protein